jgi:hypothetical protein
MGIGSFVCVGAGTTVAGAGGIGMGSPVAPPAPIAVLDGAALFA